MRYRSLPFFFVMVILVAGCSSDTPLPPLKGKREGLVVEEKFSMEHTKSTEPAHTPFVGQNGQLHLDWTQYYHEATHHLSALRTPCERDSLNKLSAMLRKGTFQSVATEGAASSPVYWNGRMYFLKGTTLYEGVFKKGLFTLEHTQNLHDVSQDARPLDKDGMGGIVIRQDGVAFVTLDSCEIVCVCLKTHRILWRVDLESPCSGAPVLGEDSVICVTRRNQTIALRQKDGKAIWNHQGNVEEVGLWGGNTAALSQGLVISHYSSNQVVALDACTGDVIWAQTFAIHKSNQGKIPHHKAAPVCVNELVYILTHSNLVCLVAQSGQILWQWPIGGADTPIIAGNFLYVVDQHGVLSCLDRHTGKISWTYTLPVHQNDAYNGWVGPWYVNNTLWVWRYDGLMMVLDARDPHQKKQCLHLKHPISASGVLISEGLMVQTDDGGVISWNLSQ